MTGYSFSMQDCHSYAFRAAPAKSGSAPHERFLQTLLPDVSGTSHPWVRRCPSCGELLAKWDEPLNGLIVNKRRYDIATTFDGIDIASTSFKDTYDASGLTGLKFIQLPDDPEFFTVQATNIVPFDAERRGTRFIKRCAVCGCFESVVGATPVYLKQGAHLTDNGFARTDLEFGTADGKGPLLLCGLSAGRTLKGAKLRGLDLVGF